MLTLQTVSLNEFKQSKPFPHLVQDNVLDTDFATVLQNEILSIDEKDWDIVIDPFEIKRLLRNKDKIPENCLKLFQFLNSGQFVSELSRLTGYDLIADEQKYYWGIHKFEDGDYLDIHVDAGVHPTTGLKKRLTLGLYLSKDWKEENNGCIELWAGDNASKDDAKLEKCVVSVLPIFNRLILFDCDDYSWHGAPEKVVCKNGEKRLFLTVSYLAELKDTDLNRKRKAFFVQRPDEPYSEEKEKFKLLRANADWDTVRHNYNNQMM